MGRNTESKKKEGKAARHKHDLPGRRIVGEYAVEYAKTNRGSCMSCRKGIEKDEMKVGLPKSGAARLFVHLDCFEVPRGAEDITNYEGYKDLEKADRKEFEDYLSGKGSSKRTQKKKDESESDDSSSSEEKKKSRVTTKGRSNRSKKDESQSDSEEDEEESDEDESDDSDEKKKKSKSSSKSSNKSSSGSKKSGYTADEQKKYNEYKEELEALKVPDLKAMLKANDQSMAGNKSELVIKIADGKVLGKIPRCPKCGGGRPRFKNGKYSCPGFQDDDKFKNCSWTSKTLAREPWVSV